MSRRRRRRLLSVRPSVPSSRPVVVRPSVPSSVVVVVRRRRPSSVRSPRRPSRRPSRRRRPSSVVRPVVRPVVVVRRRRASVRPSFVRRKWVANILSSSVSLFLGRRTI